MLTPTLLQFALHPNVLDPVQLQRWEAAQSAWLDDPTGLPPFYGQE